MLRETCTVDMLIAIMTMFTCVNFVNHYESLHFCYYMLTFSEPKSLTK